MGQGNSRYAGPPVRESELHPSALRSNSTRLRRQPRAARPRPESTYLADLIAHPSASTTSSSNLDAPLSRIPSTSINRSRFARARSSVSNTLNGRFFSRHGAGPSREPPPSLPPHSYTNNDTDEQEPLQPNNSEPPQLHVPDLDLQFDLPSWNSEQSQPSESRRTQTERPSTTIADRISSLTPDRGFRNLTASLRRRQSRQRIADDHALVLSQMLSLAATATAASLIGGSPDADMNDMRNGAGRIDNEDGSFGGFLQALRNGRLAAALGRDSISGSDADDDVGDRGTGSLDFFRMFRFGSSGTNRQRNQPQSRPSSSRNGDETNPSGDRDGETEQRMIPVLIVGIRSLNSEDETGVDGGDSMPSFLDALANFPPRVNNNSLDPSEVDNPLRRTRPTLRSRERRRASMGGLNLFSNQRERNGRTNENGQARAEQTNSLTSETPPGPHPPPTTPSSPSLSTLSSGASTPTGRNSVGSTLDGGVARRRDSFIRRMTGTGTTLEPTVEESPNQSRPPRQRRRSASETPRFGSGSSRRNGVLVEPNESASEGNRSWIIYVLGGSYPENHPILTTPSLFTDSPTYEDMVLLSSLLGPVKPPVANAEDVATAPGLFRIQAHGDSQTAVSVDGDERRLLNAGERCLICLCQYEDKEEARRLVHCEHMFHRECVDQWLTTGRNSCPLCRNQGVDEKKSDDARQATTAGAAAGSSDASMMQNVHHGV